MYRIAKVSIQQYITIHSPSLNTCYTVCRNVLHRKVSQLVYFKYSERKHFNSYRDLGSGDCMILVYCFFIFSMNNTSCKYGVVVELLTLIKLVLFMCGEYRYKHNVGMFTRSQLSHCKIYIVIMSSKLN